MTGWRHEFFKTSLSEFPVTAEIGILAAELSGLHKDPAERIIVVTALNHAAKLVYSEKLSLSWDGTIKN